VKKITYFKGRICSKLLIIFTLEYEIYLRIIIKTCCIKKRRMLTSAPWAMVKHPKQVSFHEKVV